MENMFCILVQFKVLMRHVAIQFEGLFSSLNLKATFSSEKNSLPIQILPHFNLSDQHNMEYVQEIVHALSYFLSCADGGAFSGFFLEVGSRSVLQLE